MSWNPFELIRHKINKPLERQIRQLTKELDILRSRLDLDESLVDRYVSDRHTEDYQATFSKENPLVSICIATYNRGELLTRRTLPSLLNQTYRNIEVIVVGDCCTDNTAELVARIGDSRIRFVNLEERGNYPQDPTLRWMVAGTTPMNHALSLARGDFITHLDDDDEHIHDRIEKLVHFAQHEGADMVWHPFDFETSTGQWQRNKARDYSLGNITTSSVFYHHWFAQIGWDINAWRMHEPGDWNRFRKFRYLGSKCMRYSESLLKHYREKSQSKT